MKTLFIAVEVPDHEDGTGLEIRRMEYDEMSECLKFEIVGETGVKNEN